MDVEEQIAEYIGSIAEPKRSEIQELHELALSLLPGRRLWYFDGTDSEGKTVSNPNIGYGFQTMKYADGKTRDFYRVGISGNKAGISVYILGLEDKKYLAETYGKEIGKAKVTGYCIKFKKLKDINLDVLAAAIKFGGEL